MGSPQRRSLFCDFVDRTAEPGGAETRDTVTRILQSIRAHLGMDVAFASEVTTDQVIMRYVDSAPDGPIGVGDAFPIEAGYCKRILDGRLPELMPDTSAVPAAAALECTATMPVGAHLSVPIKLRDGRVFGTFCCFSFAPDRSLNERDLQMLRAFAQLAADQIDDGMREEKDRSEGMARITEVIAHDRLMMVYQPIYGVGEGRAIGVECLARFPDCEVRAPNEWFNEAAGLGLAVDLEMFAVRRALVALPYLPRDVYLAVNVSPASILSGELGGVLADIPEGRVVIEITEHEAVLDYLELARALQPLRERARIAIDDVGAGYSGLRHILDLRPDIIKLDMSLTRDIDRDQARFTLAMALAEFARGIDSDIIAEGVETAAELQALRQLGISKAQGYYLSRPLPLPAVQQLLLAGGRKAPDPAIAAAPEPLRNRRRFRS